MFTPGELALRPQVRAQIAYVERTIVVAVTVEVLHLVGRQLRAAEQRADDVRDGDLHLIAATLLPDRPTRRADSRAIQLHDSAVGDREQPRRRIPGRIAPKDQLIDVVVGP